MAGDSACRRKASRPALLTGGYPYLCHAGSTGGLYAGFGILEHHAIGWCYPHALRREQEDVRLGFAATGGYVIRGDDNGEELFNTR